MRLKLSAGALAAKDNGIHISDIHKLPFGPDAILKSGGGFAKVIGSPAGVNLAANSNAVLLTPMDGPSLGAYSMYVSTTSVGRAHSLSTICILGLDFSYPKAGNDLVDWQLALLDLNNPTVLLSAGRKAAARLDPHIAMYPASNGIMMCTINMKIDG